MTADRPSFVRQLRAAAVLVRNGHVLLHRAEWEWFWSLPGGRLEPLEVSRPALRRELAVEFGADVDVGRLLWVVENLFSLDGADYQEVGFLLPVHRRRRAGCRSIGGSGSSTAGSRLTDSRTSPCSPPS